MSNERIDLTQFEEITPGDWVMVFEDVEDDESGIVYEGEFILVRDSTGKAIADADPFTDKDDNEWIPGGHAYEDTKAIAMIPKFLSELKRCYEEIDRKNKFVEELEKAIDKELRELEN